MSGHGNCTRMFSAGVSSSREATGLRRGQAMGQAARTSPRDIARRIRILIARQDQGDITAAARRLRIPVEDVYRLEDLLAREDPLARARLLATIVRRYDTDACWLLTGTSNGLAELPPDTRIDIARLLSEIGNRIVDEYRESRPTA